jgi:hypothetical protein
VKVVSSLQGVKNQNGNRKRFTEKEFTLKKYKKHHNGYQHDIYHNRIAVVLKKVITQKSKENK